MILLGSDNAFQIIGLQDAITLDYINDASVSGTLATLDGTTLVSMSGSYIDDSNGNYLCVLSASQTESLTACVEYVITLTATTESLQREFQQTELAIIGGFRE